MTDDDEYWVYMDISSGSYGARPTNDGMEAVDTLYANTRNNPIEDTAGSPRSSRSSTAHSRPSYARIDPRRFDASP